MTRPPSPLESQRLQLLGKTSLAVAAFILAAGTLSPSYTQAPPPAGQQPGARSGEGGKSVGHGWPVPVPLKPFHGYPLDEFVGSVTPWYYQTSATATGGKTPPGITALPRDIFTSKDFYSDRDLWMDKRYYRCNSPIGLDSIWGDYSSGPGALEKGNPSTAAWGYCDRDYPREAIVSPYPFKTAQAHYEALLAETKGRGGPTVYTKNTVPDWNGRYTRNLNLVIGRGRRGGAPGQPLAPEFAEPPQWVVGWANQMPTILSLLTPEYQKRYVQQMYHKVNSNAAQFSLMFCRPEGLLRWWSGPGGPSQLDVMVVPGRVQFLGGTDNAMRHVQIDRSFNLKGTVPNLGAEVPSWMGETIGFWDGEALITWTANVQGWFTHSSWEYSNRMQLIEIWSPRRFADGRFAGLEHETVFYDPEAFVQPVRDIRFFSRRGELKDAPPFHLEHCNQTIFLGDDGRGTQVPPGTTIQYKVRDLYDRPWARIWEEHFEKGMKRPVESDSLGGFK
jgi:hypothetical protein